MITRVMIFIFILAVFPMLTMNSFSENTGSISPRQQWNYLPDPDVLTCKDDFIFLQKNDGSPACISPSTFIKLVDRGYGKFDLSQLMKRSEMMVLFLHEIVEDERLITYWHSMMINDPKILHQTMLDMTKNLKENPSFLDHVIGPMMTNSERQKEMIFLMKKNDQMMLSLQNDPIWMKSVHNPSHDFEKKIDPDPYQQNECPLCIETNTVQSSNRLDFHQPKIMEDMVYQIWVNEKLRNKLQFFMFENPNYLEIMGTQLMSPTLEYIMADPDLRQKMILMMMENQNFMNSIRH